MNEDLHDKVMEGWMIAGEMNKAVMFVPAWIGFERVLPCRPQSEPEVRMMTQSTK